MGRGQRSYGFQLNNVVDVNQSFVLSFSARVTQEEITGSGVNFPGFGVFVASGTQILSIAIGLNDIAMRRDIVSLNHIDKSEFHDYRLEGSFLTGTADVYIDDIFIRTISAANNPNKNSLIIGDPTQTRNAKAELRSLTFTQGNHAVPEPLTILGAGTAIAFGTTFKRKLAKAKKK